MDRNRRRKIGLAGKPSMSKNTARIAIEIAYHEVASNTCEWIDHKHESVIAQASDSISFRSSLSVSVATWEDHGSIRALLFYVTEDHG